MSVKGYRFVSPGIFLKEIDQSVLDPARPERGPVVIGRFKSGPAMRPITVSSYAEFVKVYGAPHAGGSGADSWRGDAHGGPTYAAYAVEAWLAAGVAPATIVRLLGEENANATTAGKAGWDTKNHAGTSVTHVSPTGRANASAYSTNGGAYGLFIVPSSSVDMTVSTVKQSPIEDAYPLMTGSLAAVFYLTEGSVTLTGVSPCDGSTAASGSAGVISSDALAGVPNAFRVAIKNSSGATVEDQLVHFERNSTSAAGDAQYIRDAFNTDPTLTNGSAIAAADRKTYWLGETFEQMVEQQILAHSSSAWLGPDQPGGWLSSNCDLSGSTTGASTKVAADAHEHAVAQGHFATAGGQLGIILGLGNSNAEWQQHRESYADGKTGWFIAQDTGVATNYNALDAQKLFRFIGRGHGEWLQNNMKVSIENIQPSNNSTYRYGTFDVVLRHLGEKDTANNAVEIFSKCNLDPDSPSYIKRKIGDKYEEWDAQAPGGARMRTYGTYDNMSDYIRIEMNTSVDNKATAANLVPWGFYGPPRFKGFGLVDGSVTGIRAMDASTAYAEAFVEASGAIPDYMHGGSANAAFQSNYAAATGYDVPTAGSPEINLQSAGTSGTTKSNHAFRFPAPKLVHIADVNSDAHHSHFGVDWSQMSNLYKDKPNYKLDPSLKDVLRRLPAYYAGSTDEPFANNMEYSWIFTLDDVQLEFAANASSKQAVRAYHVSGSRQESSTETGAKRPHIRPDFGLQSWTAASGSLKGAQSLIKFGYNKFTTVFHGGSDGLDIQEIEPFRNTYLDDASGARTGNYAYNTVERALETVSDPEYVEYNLLAMPGITEQNLTLKAIQTCEARADALAIIDVDGGYVPYTESTATEKARRGSVTTIVSNLEARELDSSYGCAYYPWAQVRDTRSGQRVWMPPSVVGLGTMAGSQEKSEIWFAPAGFNRGGLTSVGNQAGAAGLKVLNVKERLSTKDRDDLYEQSVNPIAKFPSEGIVVFGQKTLQLQQSAMDRINVRRLLLYVKKEISIIAASTLFQQNIQVTWDSFKSKADAFLADVQSRFGLTDFLVKAMDDESASPSGVGTKTDDLVDRNIMYAQIYLKPARAIEFIAIDFIITRSGASFTD